MRINAHWGTGNKEKSKSLTFLLCLDLKVSLHEKDVLIKKNHFMSYWGSLICQLQHWLSVEELHLFENQIPCPLSSSTEDGKPIFMILSLARTSFYPSCTLLGKISYLLSCHECCALIMYLSVFDKYHLMWSLFWLSSERW